MKYTLEESIKYSKEGKIEEWVQSFLRDDKALYASPNYALADGLNLEERFYYGPVEFYLAEITPMRIETNLTGNELDYYMKKVDRMESDFNGENFPVPAEYDKYLKNLYGDYMKVPKGAMEHCYMQINDWELEFCEE